ncbi:nucleotidyltransferase domain-containing protein [Candidatus Woesearchaeota archaeon]|nr:nucleotidyltransferase domain-containing protein [Candidatus Woesearchaeota archaeon]
MSQKDYNMGIILELLRGSNHIRGIAKKLNTNQTTIARKIKELTANNVVDYMFVGKNKAYSIKKTAEARQYVFMAEHYWLLQILRKYPVIRGIVERIQKNTAIQLGVLFGSYAKGLAHKDSDIDVYVEGNDRKLKQELELLNSRASIKTGSYDKSSLVIRELEKNHVIIKGVERFYEKSRFFE